MHQQTDLHLHIKPSPFNNSLQELKDLRSQLHDAANYCQATFIQAEEKSIVVENTKEYICKAVVTLVDHLGSVSSLLNRFISQTNDFSETELKIESFKQKLVSTEQYNHTVAVSRLQCRQILPRYCQHYLLPKIITTNIENSIKDPSASLEPSCCIDKGEKDVPLFLCPSTHTTSSAKGPALVKPSAGRVFSVRNKFLTLSKGDQNPTFDFQMGGATYSKLGRSRKSVRKQGVGILSIIRGAKRNMSN